MTVPRLIAATYLGRAIGFRWLVRAPNFKTNTDLSLRLQLEHWLATGLSYHAPTEPAVTDARIANFFCAIHYLEQLPGADPV